MNQPPDDADTPDEAPPADDSPSGGYQRQMSVSVGPEDLTDPQVDETPSIVVSARAREHVTDAIAKALEGGPALEPIAREALVKRITEGMARMEQDGTSEALRFLVENIARTLERTASGAPPKQAQERLDQAKRLHALAQDGGREAVAKSLDALRDMIRDITGMRQKTSLLEDTTASAYSALNSTEHELADLRTHFERLLVMVARHAGDSDPDSAQTLDDHSAPATDRLQAAETLIQNLLVRGSPNDDALADMPTASDIAALEEEMATLRAEHDRLVSENSAFKAEQATLDEVRWALESAQDEARSLREQLADDSRQQALDAATAEVEELRYRLEAVAGHEAELGQELATTQQQVQSLNEELTSERSAAHAAAAHEAELGQELATTQQQVQSLNEELTSEHSAAQTARTETEALQAELTALRRIGDEADTLRQQVAEIPRLESELAAAQAAAGEITSQQVRIRSLEEDLAQTKKQLTAASADSQSTTEEARKLVEAQDLVQRLAADQQQLEERLSELVIERDALKAQVKARITAADNEDPHLAQELLQREVAEQAKELATLHSELEHAKIAHSDLQQRLETALAIAEESTQHQQSLQSERDATRLALGTARAGCERLEAEREQLISERDALIARIEQETEERLETSAKDFIDQSDRLRELTSLHDSLTAEHERVCSERDSARAALEAAQQQATEIERLHQDQESSNNDTCDTLASERDRLMNECDRLRTDLETARQQVVESEQLHQELETTTAERDDLRQRLEAAEQAVTETRSRAESLAGERAGLQQRLEVLEQEGSAAHKTLDAQLQHSQQTMAEVQAQQAESQAERDLLVEELNQAQTEIQALNGDLKLARAGNTAEEERIEILNAKLATLQERCATIDSAREQAEEELGGLQQRCASLEEAAAAANAEHDQVRTALEKHIAALDTELGEARDQLAGTEAVRDQAVQALDEQRQRSNALEDAIAAATVEHDQTRAALEERIASLDDDLSVVRDQLGAAEAAQRQTDEALAAAGARQTTIAEEQTAIETLLRDSEQGRETLLAELERERAACDALREELATTQQAAENATRHCATAEEDVAAHAALIERLTAAEAEAATSLTAMHQQLSQVEEERLEAVHAYERTLDNAQHEAAQAASREDDLRTALESLAATVTRLAEGAGAALAAIADGGAELGERIDAVSHDIDSGPLVDATASLGALGRALVDHAQAVAIRQLDETALYRDLAGCAERWRGAQNVLLTLVTRHGETLELAAEAEQTTREIEDRVASLDASLRERDAAVAGLETRLDEQRQRAETAETSHRNLDQELAQANAALTAAQDALAEQEELAQADHARLSERLAALNAQSETLDKELGEARQELADTQQRLAGQQTEATTALAGLLRLIEPIAHMAEAGGPLSALASTAAALRDAWPDSVDASAINTMVEELHGVIAGLASQAQEDRRSVTEQGEALTALQNQLQERSTALEEALAEQHGSAQALAHARQQLSELEKRHSSAETERERQREELCALHQEASGLRVQCQHLGEELAAVQAVAQRVPSLEHALGEASETASAQQRRHEEDSAALSEIITALKQLGLLANERFDHLGLEFTGDARQFSRSTMRWTQRIEDGDEAAKTSADYGCHLIKRISGQIQSFHDELEHTRRQRIDLESSVRDMQRQVDSQQSAQQELNERLEQTQILAEKRSQSLVALVTEKNVLHERVTALDAKQHAADSAHEQERRQWQGILDEQIASHQAAAAHLREACDEARTTAEQLAAERATLRQELDALSERASAAEAQAAHQIDELREAVQRRDDEMQRQATEIDRLKEQRLEAVGLQARISALNSKLNEATKARSLLENKLERLNETGEPEHTEARKRERQQIADLQKRLRATERQLADEHSQIASLQKSRDRQTKDWQARLATQAEELDQAQEAHEAALAQARSLSRDITGLKARIKSLEST